MIYLDNNATTKVAPEVLEVMAPYFSQDYGNPSSFHRLGQKAKRAVDEARAELAFSLGARSNHEFVFTSSGTESNNTAIRSALKTNPSKKRVVTTAVEHSSIKNLCRALQKDGYEIVSVGVSKTGALNGEEFEAALTDDTAIVSVMWANNETGVLFPIERMAQKVKERGILFHVDAVQAAGKILIPLSKIPVDFFSLSAHKFHGPKGIGALFVREGTAFEPLMFGGGQELDRRSGTEHVPGIVGLGKSITISCRALQHEWPRVERLRNRLENELLQLIPESFVNGKSETRIPNTTNITVPGIEAETLLTLLSNAGIAASSGSACSTGALEPSHVLQAMGHSRELAMGSLRLSLSRYTTEKEIEEALKIIPPIVSKLRELNRAEAREVAS